MSGEDRADRLRRRRQRSRDRALTDESGESDESAESETDETTESAETAKPNDAGETDGTDETSEADESDGPKPSVKDEQKPTYMYLPHGVRRDLDRAYSILKAEYEYEYEESFEKNRHFYPLVVSLGLEAVDELDAEDVRSRLEEDR
ncbi:hypothetical protein NDI76_19135 [Halogeometricum sp. S1BR25-6]|uniref:DUF8160 domain-containing protein n=1 Tax=Halogeometricum salsisoli TaxID=2950536 RepID=A0ABU2GKR5_9EURY|nr:hypothetical protein [Halogeometricum sp. S1BR25-6]MDS0300868.1 hypothetical protein [Halogeometricum sp. S1BR25-6]